MEQRETQKGSEGEEGYSSLFCFSDRKKTICLDRDLTKASLR